MQEFDQLVPDPLVAKEFHITLMTIWRWDRSAEKRALGWPPKVKIGERNFRPRSGLEKFKDTVLQRALAERDPVAGGQA